MSVPTPMRRVLAAALVASLVAAGAHHAFAHAIPVESDPSDGAIVAQSPNRVKLRLSEKVSAQFSTAQLLDSSGRIMAGIEIPIAQPEPNLLVFALPKLSDGAYTLFWKTLSMDDGHFTKGLLQFGVGPAADLASATLPTISSWPAPYDVAVRWLNLALLVLLIGGIGASGLVLGGRIRPDPEAGPLLRTARARACAWSLGCASSAFVAGGAVLLAETAALLSTQPAQIPLWQSAWQVLHDTRWGELWMVRQGLLLALIGATLVLYRRARAATGDNREAPRVWRSVPWLSASALSLGLVTIQALSGHAGSVGDGVAWAVGADALHVLAAGLWVGGIFALAYALLPLMRRGRVEFAALARDGWARFSRIAALAVVLLLATGLYAVGRQVASLDALITTFYGLSVLTKIALVLAMGTIGLVNVALLHPERVPAALARLGQQISGGLALTLMHLPHLIRADMSMALLVLALTAAITASAPPLGAEFTIAPEDVRRQQSGSVDDLTVTLSAKPDHPGQNLLTVFAGSNIRPAKAEIIRVALRFAFQGRDLGHLSATAEQVEPGRYVVAGRQLSVAGRWRIDVVVRRSGVPDAIVPFEWTVPPAAALSPTILSKQPLRETARVLSAAILVVALGAILMRVCGNRMVGRDIASVERGAATAHRAQPSAASKLTAQ